VSPDGRFVLGRRADGTVWIFAVDGAPPRPFPGLAPGETSVTWTEDGRGVYVYSRGTMPIAIYRIDVQTGGRTLSREIVPADVAGIRQTPYFVITPNGRWYVYVVARLWSDLCLVGGLR
jgi:hypothetical protein